LHSATSGTIEVDGREGIGLCPQKNVLWDDVSVLEHVNIFNSLKSLGVLSTKTENEDLIAACDLAMKQDARSKTLSGGQKRYVFNRSKATRLKSDDKTGSSSSR